MKIGDITKLVVAIFLIASITFLLSIGAVTGEAGVALLGAIAGYILGNATRVLTDKYTAK